MTQEHKTVFISYRRRAAAFIARAVFQDLRANGYDVFMDVENIDGGTFDTIILGQIKAKAHFVIILTPGTVKRFTEPDDFLRREIEYAMETQRNIVPLLVGGFSFSGANKYLTGKLSELQRYNGLEVPHTFFEPAMERLRSRFLKQPVYGNVVIPPASDQLIVQEKIAATANQPIPTDKELSAEEYFNLGQLCLDNDDLKGALQNYDKSISLNPQYPEAYHRRGIAKRRGGDVNGAMDDQTYAIGLNPQYVEAYNNRAGAKAYKSDFIGALKDYDQAISISPTYATALSNRGEVYFIMEQYDLALADFREAIRLRPMYNMTRAGFAITLYLLEHISEAKAIWNALVAQDVRYLKANWVGKNHHWAQPHIEAARKLIAELNK